MKVNSRISLSALTALTVLAPVFTRAEECGYIQSTGKIIPCGDDGTGTTDQLSQIIKNITDWVLGFAGTVAVLFIIWGGIQYITAAGNEKQAEAAKQTLTYAVLGLIVILLAYVIVQLVVQSLIPIVQVAPAR